MKISQLGTAIALAVAATGAQAVTFNFDNSTTAGVQGTDFNYTVCTGVADKAGTEFRMCDPSTVALGGGLPLKKDTINGSESWTFVGSDMTAVANTGLTAGLSATSISYGIPSGDANGGPAIDQGADFFGNGFGFLANTLGSTAGDSYGAGQYAATSATTFTVSFGTLEAQWGGTSFPMADVVFSGTTDGTNFSMWAEHTILASEDPGAAGFADWTAQWYYVGTIDGFVAPAAVPVPAAVWLFGSGLIGLAGVARRRKSA